MAASTDRATTPSERSSRSSGKVEGGWSRSPRFAVGGATQTVPMYVAELAPARKRGRLVLTFQLGVGVGIVLATLVGASEASPWRVSVGAAAVPAAVMLLLMLRLPESPRWLVLTPASSSGPAPPRRRLAAFSSVAVRPIALPRRPGLSTRSVALRRHAST